MSTLDDKLFFVGRNIVPPPSSTTVRRFWPSAASRSVTIACENSGDVTGLKTSEYDAFVGVVSRWIREHGTIGPAGGSRGRRGMG